MSRSEYVARWSDASFVKASAELLNQVFSEKAEVVDADLRGIIVGLDGAMPALVYGNLYQVNLRRVDASDAQFSCSFNDSVFTECRFDRAAFDTCRFKHARFFGCSFEKADLDSPFLDDAEFVECRFPGTLLRGRNYREYGGRRVRFERCQFQGSRFKNVQFRAARFVDCQFEKVKLVKCLLAGTAISGSGLTKEDFGACEIIGTTINGVPL